MTDARALHSPFDSYSASVWLDDDGEDTPMGGGVPDPSQRHWRHPSEVAAELAALQSTEPVAAEQTSSWPVFRPFGALLGSIGVCAVAIVAVVLSGFGDKPLTVGTYQTAAPNNPDEPASTSPQDANSVDEDASDAEPTLPASEAMPPTTIDISSKNEPSPEEVDEPDREALTQPAGSVDVPTAESSTTVFQPSSTIQSSTTTGPVDSQNEQPADDWPKIDWNELDQLANGQIALTSALDKIPKLLAEPDRDSRLLGSYVVGEGFILTSNTNLDQADYAVIANTDSWVVLQPIFQVSGIAILVPTAGHTLAGMTPQIEMGLEPTLLGQKVSVGLPDQTISAELVGTITSTGKLLATDIEYRPSLAGAPLYNSSGQVVGVVAAPSTYSKGDSKASVVAISIADAATLAQSYISSESVTIAMLGDLEIESSITGVFVRDVPLVSTSANAIDQTSWFEVGDKINVCDGLPIGSMVDLVIGTTRVVPGTTINCSVTREGSEVLVRHPVGSLTD